MALRGLVALVLMAGSCAARAVDWEYAVRPGDSLWQLAHRYCGNVPGVERLAKHNGLNSPDALRPGMVLRIPVECLIRRPANARLVVGESSVFIERAGAQLTLRAGGEIQMGDTLTTGDQFAVVEFADQSRLTIRPHSVISFLMLTAHGDSGMVDTLLRLRKGRVQHDVKGGSGQGHHHRIATPVGAAAVRGTKFRVEVPDGEGATVATTEGEVGFAQESFGSTSVPAGQGLVASTTGSYTEPLLPAPDIDSVASAGVGSRLSWSEVVNATGYRTTLFRDGKPVDESVLSENHWDVDVPLGVYLLTVRAIATNGLEGLDAQVTLEVVPAAPSGAQANPDHAGVPVQFSWTPSAEDPGPFVVRVKGSTDDPQEFETTSSTLEVSLEPGNHEWQVVSRSGSAGEWQPLSLKPEPPSGVTVARQARELPLLISSSHASESIGGYRVEVLRHGKVVTEREFGRTSNLIIEEVPNCQPCQVRVAVTAAGLLSDYTQLEFRDSPGHPWPIYLVLALLAVSL